MIFLTCSLLWVDRKSIGAPWCLRFASRSFGKRLLAGVERLPKLRLPPMYWVAAKALKLSYHDPETILFIIYIYIHINSNPV